MYRTKWWLAAFLIAVCGNQIASANPPTGPKLPPLWRGILCLAVGRYERTIAVCDELLRNEPDNRRAYALRGYAHLSKKNEERQAIADFSEALRRGFGNAAIYVARAQAYRQAKDYDRAIADCTEAIRIDPNYGEAYAWRGGCYLSKRVTSKAIADYSLALRHAPYLAWARCGRAEAYRRGGESARALAELEEVLRDDPENEQALCFRCFVYLMNLHDCDRVLAESSELIRRNPRQPMWYMLRGMAYLANEEITKGLRDWTTAGTLKPGFLRLYCRRKKRSLVFGFDCGTFSSAASGEDDPDEQIAACTKRLASDPNSVAAYYERACVYINKREYKQAIADFDEIIRRDPTDAAAYLERSRAHHALKAYAHAIADCTKAVQIDPNNADHYYARASAYEAQGKIEEAIRDSSQALRLDPRIAYVHVLRGYLYNIRKDHAAALAEFSEAIRLSPSYEDAYIQRGWGYADSGKYAEAIADFKEVLQFDPQNPIAHRCLGWWLAICPDAQFRDGKEAKKHATTACEATEWKEPVYLDILAAACAECGDFDRAIEWQTRALQLVPEKDKADFRQRLDLYQSHQPYHKAAAHSVSVPSSQ